VPPRRRRPAAYWRAARRADPRRPSRPDPLRDDGRGASSAAAFNAVTASRPDRDPRHRVD
jgi:hypothetical protein